MVSTLLHYKTTSFSHWSYFCYLCFVFLGLKFKMVVYSHVIKMLTEQLDVFIASSLHGAGEEAGQED